MSHLSPTAKINPRVLEWVREQGGYTPEEMARKANTETERYAAWEKGEARPTITQIQRLAHGVRRPVSLFFYDKKPAPDPQLPDFRQLPRSQHHDLSPESRLEIRMARERRQELIGLFEESGALDDLPFNFDFVGSANMRTRISDLANRARKILDVAWPPYEQLESQYAAFNYWRNSFERIGILVFQGSIDADEFRAAAVAENPFPVVLVSSQDSIAARTFSLLHELGHLFLGQSNLSNVWKGGQSEAYCNDFAAEMLMPEKAFRADPLVKQLSARPANGTDLRQLSRKFWASQYAVAMRLVKLDLQRPGILSVFRDAFNREGSAAGSGSGGGEYYTLQISKLGPLLIQTTLRAMEADKITPLDAYRILGVKPGNLDNLRLALGE